MASEIDPAQVILDRIAAREVERARVEAATSADMLELQDLRRQQAETEFDPERRRLRFAYAADELSKVLFHAPRTVQNRLAAARRIRGTMPLTWQAHLDGEIDSYRVGLIAAAAEKLRDPESRARLDHRVGRYASNHTPSQVKGWLNRFVARAEPEAARARARDEYAKRSLWAKHGDDGMTRLTAYIKTTDAAQISDLLTTMARNKPSGDRNIDQMRADAFVDQMLGRGHSSTNRRAVIGVVATLESLAGLTDEPGVALDGSFALPADMVRDLAAEPGTIFYRILKNPLGHILDIAEIGYRPSSKLRRAVEFRDGTCQFATCSRPAVECDLDHQIPWPHGPTHADNLQALCRRHHQMKTHLGISIGEASDFATPAG